MPREKNNLLSMGTELGTNKATPGTFRESKEKEAGREFSGTNGKYQELHLALSCLPSPGLGMSVISSELFVF